MLGLHGLHNAFRGLPDVEVVAHVDPNPENIQEKMRYTGAKKHYLCYADMLDREKPDIVVLCSRHPHDHLPQIEALAGRGINVYCEKPMTVSLEEADKIIGLAEKHHIKICMAHPARYALSFQTMKAMVESGEIGTPLTVYGRGKCDHRGGGEDLVVLGTHILDLQTFFFGAPEYVFAEILTEGRPVVKSDRTKTTEPLGPVAGDEVFASFHFSGGIRGIFESRRGLSDVNAGIIHMGITVIGMKGTLSMRFNDSLIPSPKLRISRISAPPEDYSDYREVPLVETRFIPGAAPLDYSMCGMKDIPREPFFLESNRFAAWDLIQAIREDRLPFSNQYNARLVQEMIDGIYTSHLSGKRLSFPLASRINALESYW